MLGWWMVTITVRPDEATLRTALITMAAARASRPGHKDAGNTKNTIIKELRETLSLRPTRPASRAFALPGS